MGVKAIPEGFHNITPYLGIQKAAEAIDFYKKPSMPPRSCAWPCPTAASGMQNCG